MDHDNEPARSVGAPALRVQELHKRYGAVVALDGLSLEIEPGEVYGFLGRNGAGKTTTIRVIMGISGADSGWVSLLGQPLSSTNTRARQSIGYVAQEQNFYGWMTAETIGRFVSGFYPTWEDSEYRRLLGLLEVPTDRKLRAFSQGMSAKLALALALAHHPRLLVLDEPTAGMDAVARREFLEIVRDNAERARRTVLFSSHLIDEVELAADRLGIIDAGRTLYQGSVGRLQATITRFTRAELPAPTLLQSAPLAADLNVEN